MLPAVDVPPAAGYGKYKCWDGQCLSSHLPGHSASLLLSLFRGFFRPLKVVSCLSCACLQCGRRRLVRTFGFFTSVMVASLFPRPQIDFQKHLGYFSPLFYPFKGAKRLWPSSETAVQWKLRVCREGRGCDTRPVLNLSRKTSWLPLSRLQTAEMGLRFWETLPALGQVYLLPSPGAGCTELFASPALGLFLG